MTPSKLVNSLGRGFIPRPKSNSVISSFLVSFIRRLEIGNSASVHNIGRKMIFANFCLKTNETKKRKHCGTFPPIPPFNSTQGGKHA